MIGRPDREDLTAQIAAANDAREHLAQALHVLAVEATSTAKAVLRGKKPSSPNLDTVIAAYLNARRSEESLDLALLDLATAGGADA